jgi:glycosyltransferase involved in cell wall biosynthesis
MDSPFFSIVIPTRNRGATFRYTLATVLAQGGNDYEVVVADNFSEPGIKAAVDETGSSKIRYLRSETILPMTDNWEMGLGACRGEYIMILGDDDGLVPSSLSSARKLIDATQAKIISWEWHTYWWPDTIAYWNRNRLYVLFDRPTEWRDPRHVLLQFYRGATSFLSLPMIYNSFVHRSVVECARARHGRYFPVPNCPDVVSGILNSTLVERFVSVGRSLSVGGVSGRSYGTAHWARSLGSQQREEFWRYERSDTAQALHKSLISSPNTEIVVASAKLHCRDLLFPGDEGLNVDIANLVSTLVRNLNTDPDAYEDNLADARTLAAKHGLSVPAAEIPAKREADRRSSWGPIMVDGKVTGVGVNCDLLGISDICGAARAAEALLAPVR